MVTQVPHIFATLPTGEWPVSYFDDNFAVLQNELNIVLSISGFVQQYFAGLPTTPPLTNSTVWNNGGVICITPPGPLPGPTDLLTSYFATLPTALPTTHSTVWNDGGVISITGL